MKTKELMGIRPEVWNVLKGRFARMAIGLLGYSLRIITLPEHSDDLGMTDAKRNVYLNPYHELIKGLTEPEAIMFIMGVFGHEEMHQKMTNFSLYEKAGKEKPEHEQEIFHMICNIIEDPAIEYFASRCFGGKLLEALHFSVMYIYKQSVPIDEKETASEQFFNAMIQYGDGGLLKGEFTFPEARKTFHEILPYFDKAIESFDSKTRLENMEKVFELSRPLWIDETEALKELMELLKKLGKDHSSSSGRGNPKFKPSEGNSEGTKTEKRRKVTFRRISKEEAEEIKKNGDANEKIPADGDIEVLIVEDDEDGKVEKESTESPCGTTGSSTPGDESDPIEESGIPSTGKGEVSDDDSTDDGSSYGIADEEYKLTEERAKEIIAEIECMLLEAEAAEIEQKEADGEVIDVPELERRYTSVKCRNHRVATSQAELLAPVYANVVSRLSGSIAILASQLKRIFRADIEERERRTSGRLNIKRLSTGTPSTRVFDRKRLPSNKKDTAILLLIDISGSMKGSKVQMAKLAAILLVEVFAKVGVTVKVVGFTDNGGTPQHFHYTSWKNIVTERPKLLEIAAKRDNYDGYSIRYAGELLKRRPESHKLLMVISDGYPASNAYKTFSAGIADTRNAIHEVSRIAKVFGVLIGGMDAEQHHIMYGNNLLHINKIDELPQRLAKKISLTIKEW